MFIAFTANLEMSGSQDLRISGFEISGFPEYILRP
jgi:hypothetical protein